MTFYMGPNVLLLNLWFLGTAYYRAISLFDSIHMHGAFYGLWMHIKNPKIYTNMYQAMYKSAIDIIL